MCDCVRCGEPIYDDGGSVCGSCWQAYDLGGEAAVRRRLAHLEVQ